jgi:hypothetical protein
MVFVPKNVKREKVNFGKATLGITPLKVFDNFKLKIASKHPILTTKGPRPFFCPFWKFGQAIVDAIFVQKISNFR